MRSMVFTVEFNGTAPRGTATVNSLPTTEAGSSLHYTLDTAENLCNGDTVTLTVSSNRGFQRLYREIWCHSGRNEKPLR